jgi:hypothetical protein
MRDPPNDHRSSAGFAGAILGEAWEGAVEAPSQWLSIDFAHKVANLRNEEFFEREPTGVRRPG